MKQSYIEVTEKKQMKVIPEFRIGDTISVTIRIVEEGGKERMQTFTGTVIARKGRGISETVSLHRVAYGEGMERIFYLHSPLIHKIEVVKQGAVRRSKLYYLRKASGKKARVKSRYDSKKTDQAVEKTEVLVESVEQ